MKSKISMRQACMLVVSMLFSPAARLFSAYLSGKGNQSGWIAPLIAGAVTILFILILWQQVKQKRSFLTSLDYCLSENGAKAVLVLYLIWGTFLTALHLRYYSARLASTVYTWADLDVFVIAMVVICIYALYGGISSISRVNEIFLPIILVTGIILSLFVLPKVSYEQLFPISDAKSIEHVVLCNLSSYIYIFFVTFFIDDIADPENFKKHSIISQTVSTLLTTLMFACIKGTQGPFLISKIPYPFFSAVKQISIGEFLQHIEAFIITLWIMSDFIIIVFTASVMLKILQKLTGRPETKEFIIPYMVLCGVLVDFTGATSLETEMISEKIFIIANMSMCFVIPILITGVSCIKDKIKLKKV